MVLRAPTDAADTVDTFDQVPQGCGDLGAGSFDFDDRQVGTTSPAQRFVLGVFDNDTFNPKISVSGDYAQTNDCPPMLSVTGVGQVQGCQIDGHLRPHGHRAQERHPERRTGGPHVGAHRHRGHHADSPPPDLQVSGKKKQDPRGHGD